MRWLIILTIVLAAFFALRFYWNDEQVDIQSELDVIAAIGNPSDRFSKIRLICFDDQFGTRGEGILKLANKIEPDLKFSCSKGHSCCFGPLDSDIPRLIATVRKNQIECTIPRFNIVLEEAREVCVAPLRLTVSRDVFQTTRDPRDGMPRRLGDAYYRISEQPR
jgi:hypothetical protein